MHNQPASKTRLVFRTKGTTPGGTPWPLKVEVNSTEAVLQFVDDHLRDHRDDKGNLVRPGIADHYYMEAINDSV